MSDVTKAKSDKKTAREKAATQRARDLIGLGEELADQIQARLADQELGDRVHRSAAEGWKRFAAELIQRLVLECREQYREPILRHCAQMMDAQLHRGFIDTIIPTLKDAARVREVSNRIIPQSPEPVAPSHLDRIALIVDPNRYRPERRQKRGKKLRGPTPAMLLSEYTVLHAKLSPFPRGKGARERSPGWRARLIAAVPELAEIELEDLRALSPKQTAVQILASRYAQSEKTVEHKISAARAARRS